MAMDDAAHIRSAVAERRLAAAARRRSCTSRRRRAVPVALLVEAAGLALRGGCRLTGGLDVRGGLTAIVALAPRALPVGARHGRSRSIEAAHRADAALSLHDRLTSALSFLDEREAPSPLDARGDRRWRARRGHARSRRRSSRASRMPRERDRHAARDQRSSAWRCSRTHAPRRLKPPPHAEGPRFVVEADALAAERRSGAAHGRRIAKGKDPELSALAAKLDALLAAVDQQKLSRAEAFAQLARDRGGAEDAVVATA